MAQRAPGVCSIVLVFTPPPGTDPNLLYAGCVGVVRGTVGKGMRTSALVPYDAVAEMVNARAMVVDLIGDDE